MAGAGESMVRNGTVTLLGAGASADAEYQTAGGLLERFRTAVEDASRRELEHRKQIKKERLKLERQAAKPPPGTLNILLPELRPQPTTGEWFQTMWERFEAVTARLRPLAVPKLRPDGRPDRSSAVVYGPAGLPLLTDYVAPLEGEPPSPARTPYLETFFAFYDDYLRPIIAAREVDPSALRTTQHRFRRLRELAIETAYRVFSPHGRPAATYLRPLFKLRGPESRGCAIATLNFDVTVEHEASAVGVDLWDGFSSNRELIGDAPQEWSEHGLEKLLALWRATEENGLEFVGFQKAPAKANLLLKLHGSLGWYVLEEGSGDIGSRDELRHNTAYKHFRLPYELLWSPDTSYLIDQLASGGPDDPITRTGVRPLSRKAGAVWVRPYLVFARAMKAHPDRVSVELIATFAQLLEAAAAVLVIGYSWGDPHVNDLIFDAVARGALLVNVSRQARPESVLALWTHRFPSTFHLLRQRLFIFGGGAQRVLDERTIDLPSGASQEFDLVGSLPHRLPIELSLKGTLN